MADRAHPTPAAVEAARQVFGEHPEDVAGALGFAGEAFAWLEELAAVMADIPVDHKAMGGSRIRNLAACAKFVAEEAGRYARSRHESIMEHLVIAGAPASGPVTGGTNPEGSGHGG